jgi:GNAT superfamily N-acetyltransferase
MLIRLATMADARELASLLADYLGESFPDHRGTPVDRLQEEVLGRRDGQRIVVAEEEKGALIGFMAWDRVYDLHWAKAGAQIADLYVAPARRGHGIALMLTAAACSFAREEGATFLRGGSYDRDSPTGRFYERFAIGADSAECHCSGRAFRHLAGLHGSPPRTLARSLPPREWNYEA